MLLLCSIFILITIIHSDNEIDLNTVLGIVKTDNLTITNYNSKGRQATEEVIKLKQATHNYNSIDASGQDFSSNTRKIIELDDLVASIDKSIDPCEDFYSHVCNGWIKEHPITEQKYRSTQTELMMENMMLKIKDILQNKPQNSQTREMENMYNYYQKCVLHSNTTDPVGAELLLDKLREIRSNQIKYITDWMISMYPDAIFYDLLVAPDERNSSRNVLTIFPASSMMPYSSYFDPAYAKKYVLLRNALFKVLQLLPSIDPSREFFHGSETENWRRVESFLKVDQFMAKITEENQAYPESIMVNVEELGELLPSINWRKFLTFLLPDRFHPNMRTMDVVIEQTQVVRRFEDVLQQMDNQVLADYLDWKIIMKYIEFLGENFQKISEDYENELFGIGKSDRSKTCVKDVTMMFSDIIGELFLNKYFNFDTVPQVKEIIETIKESFLRLLSENVWMDNATKEKARNKAHEIKDVVGFYPIIFNLTAREIKYQKLVLWPTDTFFEMNEKVSLWARAESFEKLDVVNSWQDIDTGATQVNAFYTPSNNQIALMAGILQRPFFDPLLPKILNLGGIGVVTGHEITHGFDTYGAHFDEHGNRNNWWNDETFENFENKKGCFTNQYGNISYQDTGVFVDGRRTESENIADNGGMRSAILAAKEAVNTEKFVIKGMENLSQMQYFFYSYAYSWCGSARLATILSDLAEDSHSPDVYRVNVVLSNQPEFSEHFKCAVGSKMNAAKMCTVWKRVDSRDDCVLIHKVAYVFGSLDIAPDDSYYLKGKMFHFLLFSVLVATVYGQTDDTTTAAITTTKVLTSPTCRDSITYCNTYKNGGYCSMSAYRDTMITQCKATCGFCKVGSATCADSQGTTVCASYAQSGFCTNTQYSLAIRKEYCGKTCSLC